MTEELDFDLSLEGMLRCPICGSKMSFSWEECAAGDVECVISADCDNGCGSFMFGDACVLRGKKEEKE